MAGSSKSSQSGEVVKRGGWRFALWLVFGLFALQVIVRVAGGFDQAKPAAPAPTAAPDPRQLRAAAAGTALKASLRDPASLVIEKGRVSDDGSVVCIDYRARNGFGGMNREYVAFDKRGAMQTGPAYWNAHCSGMMTVMTWAVEYGARQTS